MPRVQFAEKTKLILAQRAAYRCSFPNCNRLTIGPGPKEDQVENTGQAAHIYSASAGGPRGQGMLTSKQLKAPSNGIWMCGHHADLIDKNTGIRYSTSVIKSWKALHEYRVAYEHSGRTNSFGFVRSLHIDQCSLFGNNVRIEFGKTTFLIGPNASGKTALCQWLSVVDSLRHLSRWLRSHWLNNPPLKFSIIFDAPVEHSLSVAIDNGPIRICLDGSPAVFNYHRIAVTFLENRRKKTYNDDLEHLSDTLNLDNVSMQSLAAQVSSDTLFVRSAKFKNEWNEDGKQVNSLYCTLASGAQMPFSNLSGGEQGRVLLEFAIAHMHNVAVFAPALLIVEWHGLGIHDTGLKYYLEYLSAANCTFQTLITMSESAPLIENFGWQTFRIIEGRGADRVWSIVPVE